MKGQALGLLLGWAVLTGVASPLRARVAHTADLDQAIDKIFEQYDRKTTPGCSVAIIDDGRLVLKKSYGMADPALGVPMRTSISSWIPYSEARVFVAMAIGKLANDKKISLDDPVSRYVPQLPPYAHAVTIRHLLHHVSGLADYGILAGPGFELGDRLSEDEFFRMLARWGSLTSVPGASQMYSNTDYALLKILIERVSGMSLHGYLTTTLLQPAGMSMTRIGVDQSQSVAGHALFHEADGGGFRRLLRYRVSPVGGISVTTSLDDIVRFDRALREPAWSAILKGLENGTSGSEGSNGNEGFSFGIYPRDTDNRPLVEYRGIGKFTYLVRIPTAKLSVATLCNAYAGMDGFAARVANTYLSRGALNRAPRSGNMAAPTSIVVGPDVATPLSELQSYVGEYRDASGGVFVDVSLVDGRLSISPRGRASFPDLKSLGDGRFGTQIGGKPFVLQFKPQDVGMLLTSWDATANEAGGPPLRRRLSWQPILSDLPSFAGVYRGDKVEITLHIRADGQHLHLATAGLAEASLIPGDKAYEFRLPDTYQARFERNATGNVVAVVLNANRLQGIRFTKVD